MSHILHMMLHPHGWWIVLDLVVLGSSGTLWLLAADDG